MQKPLARYAIWSMMTAVGCLLVAATLYFVRGSLEEFPTADDQRKVRLVMGVFIMGLVGIEAGLWWLSRSLATVTRSSSSGG